MSLTREQKLELLVAYRSAGLMEKAQALEAELLSEEVGSGADSGLGNLNTKMDDIQTRMREAQAKLTELLGVPLPPPRRGRRR